jgi:hypothetical protein
LIREALVWLQTELGKGTGDTAQSWSEALLGSLNFWGLLEGTHLLTLVLFAGTIFVVDLRLLGVTFRKTPVSVVSDKILPLTVAGFVILIATGLALFFAKPLVYYHNIWFRAKLVFLVLAMLNIAVFHGRVQKNQAAWDTLELPPRGARIAAVLSLISWLLVIAMGRFIPYNWFDCGKPIPHIVNVLQDCKTSEHPVVDKEDMAKLGAAKPEGQAQ